MKRFFYFFVCVALLAMSACSKAQSGAFPVADSFLTVTIGGQPSGPDTKSTPGTAAENSICNLYLFVFDENGMLDLSHRCLDAELTARKATLKLKTGIKTVCALANLNEGLAARVQSVFRLQDLLDMSYVLGDNASDALVMRGFSPGISVSAGGANTTVDLARGVARIVLGEVTNKLPAPYGSVTIVRTFLCNVAGNQNLRGTAATTAWLNREATAGHVAGRVIGIGGNAADCPALTFTSLGTAIPQAGTRSFAGHGLYAFPNALTTPNSGFHDNFTPTATVLMVVVLIQGRNYYYPVVLSNGVAENTEYTVNLTLVGLGNTEDKPFAKIDKGNLTAVVHVLDWTSTSPISEII